MGAASADTVDEGGARLLRGPAGLAASFGLLLIGVMALDTFQGRASEVATNGADTPPLEEPSAEDATPPPDGAPQLPGAAAASGTAELAEGELSFEGCVVAAETGEPIAAARVHAYEPEGFWAWFDDGQPEGDDPESKRLVVDRGGNFGLPAGWPHRGVVLRVTAPGRAIERLDVADLRAPRSPSRREVRLAEGVDVVGRVVGDAGGAGAWTLYAVRREALDLQRHPDLARAVRGVLCDSAAQRSPRIASHVRVSEGNEREFRLPGLVRGAGYLLYAFAWRGRGGSGVLDVRATSTPASIEAKPWGSFAPVLLDAEGSVIPFDGSGDFEVLTSLESPITVFVHERRLQGVLPSGGHRVRITANGHWPSEHEVVVGEMATREGNTLRFAPGRALAGVVVSAGSGPIGRATVRIDVEGAAAGRVASHTLRTDAEGRFAVRGVPEGRLTMLAHDDQFASAPRTVAASRDDLRLVLDRRAGFVVELDAGPDADRRLPARIATRVEGATPWEVRGALALRHTVLELEADPDQVIGYQALLQGYRIADARVRLSEVGADGIVHVPLEPAPRLACRASNAAGEPLGSADVLIRYLGEGALLRLHGTHVPADADGSFSVPLPTDDPLELHVIFPGGGRIIRRVERPAAVRGVLELRPGR